MKKSKNRIFLLCFLLVSLGLSSVLFITSKIYNSYSNQKFKIDYNNGLSIIEQLPGTYTSTDGKTITVAEDGTTKYLDTYTLTVTESATGNVISGKVGTNNKAATFYQLNNHMIVSSDVISYTHNGVTEYLYDYTIFALDSVPIIDSNGIFELYSSDEKKASYATLQDAVDSANSGDIIKISKNAVISEGAYIDKNITIEGNNHTLDKSKWANPVIIINENVDVNIFNLNIDGGATNFEVDYSLSYPKVKEGTLDLDPVANSSTILSKGNLKIENIGINNLYSNSTGGAIRILRGSANIKNGTFNHNLGKTRGASIHIGSSLKNEEINYPIKNVIIDNCNFTDNFTSSGNGGAIYGAFAETIKITNTNFIRNMASAYTAGGGAIYFGRENYPVADRLGLEYIQVYIDGCLFEQNYSGNDGYAIQNEAAEMYITNTRFTKNVGLSSDTSVGTVSCMLDGSRWYDVTFENVTFDNNVTGASVFGDHGTLVNLKMKNVDIYENKGNMSILLYAANAEFENVDFRDETVTSTVLDVRPYVSQTKYPLYTPQEINLKNMTFENTDGPTDILVRRRNHDMSLNHATLNINGDVKANVEVWDATYVNINGALSGDVLIDDVTPLENVIIAPSGNVDGEVIDNKDTYIVTVYYPKTNSDTNSVEYLYLKKDKTYTEKEIFMFLKNQKEEYTMKLYTDNKYTTPWDYTSTKSMTVYGKWEEHTHEFDGTFVINENSIYEQCKLGHFGKNISLSIPTENTYNGNEIPITVNNSLNAKDYKIIYYVKDNDEWKEINSVPIEVGNYKAVLTYNNLEISQEYSILEPPKVEEPEKEEPKEEDKKEEESKEEDKTEENIPPILEEEKEEKPKEEPKDENNPFTSSSSIQFVVMILGIIAFVIFIIAQKRIDINKL